MIIIVSGMMMCVVVVKRIGFIIALFNCGEGTFRVIFVVKF